MLNIEQNLLSMALIYTNELPNVFPLKYALKSSLWTATSFHQCGKSVDCWTRPLISCKDRDMKDILVDTLDGYYSIPSSFSIGAEVEKWRNRKCGFRRWERESEKEGIQWCKKELAISQLQLTQRRPFRQYSYKISILCTVSIAYNNAYIHSCWPELSFYRNPCPPSSQRREEYIRK